MQSCNDMACALAFVSTVEEVALVSAIVGAALVSAVAAKAFVSLCPAIPFETEAVAGAFVSVCATAARAIEHAARMMLKYFMVLRMLRLPPLFVKPKTQRRARR